MEYEGNITLGHITCIFYSEEYLLLNICWVTVANYLTFSILPAEHVKHNTFFIWARLHLYLLGGRCILATAQVGSFLPTYNTHTHTSTPAHIHTHQHTYTHTSTHTHTPAHIPTHQHTYTHTSTHTHTPAWLAQSQFIFS